MLQVAVEFVSSVYLFTGFLPGYKVWPFTASSRAERVWLAQGECSGVQSVSLSCFTTLNGLGFRV